jgi:hypothetical protein
MTDNQSKSVNLTPNKGSLATSEVDTFLAELRQRRRTIVHKPFARGRLIFGLDATASRQPVWDTACQIQAEMFREATAVGGLELQLVYYRGLGECRASKWIANSEQLAKTMSQIMRNAGQTQIEKILTHAQKETKLLRVSALVFVGDAMEENPDTLAHEANALGCLGVPAFMFQEGRDPDAEHVFRTIANLTKGAYCRFNSGAARELAELLRAVAVYAAGGLPALAARRDAGAVKLLGQLR